MIIARLLSLIGNVITGVFEARAMAERFDRLQRMSDKELARFGLTRADIPQAAVNGMAR